MSNVTADLRQALQRAIQFHQAGNMREAEALYRQILAVNPREPNALHLLGILAKQTGHLDAAVDLMSQAIQSNPSFPEALSNLGLTLGELGRHQEAIACCRKAIALAPNFPEAYSNLGNPLRETGHIDEAIACYRKAISLRPDFSDCYNNLGNAFRDKGQLEESVNCYRKSISIAPNSPLAWCNLGIVLRDMGRMGDAISCCRKAIELKPDFAEAHSNLANALTDSGKLNEAIISYRRAIELKPNSHEACCNLGNAFKDTGQLDEAIASYRQSVVLKPDYSDAHSNVLMTLNYHPATTREIILDESVRWARQHAEPLRQFIKPLTNDRNLDRRLKIGYVSADLREHAVARFLLPMLAEHDSQAFEIFCYARVPHPDAMTERLKEHADVWRSIVGLKNDRIAELIREDKVDILVDLGLHSAHNPLMIFARKPAPVQVTYLAYCSTSGMDTMDYRITDPYLDPPGLDDAFYSEESIRLPETYWCYQPSAPTPEPNPLPALQAGQVTFGSLNSFFKVSQPTQQTWCQLLKAVPGSRFILHAKEGIHRERIINLLIREGIDPARLHFAGHVPASKYFEQYLNIDIGLDPFPYTGGTTTCDALWMGVPVVSLAGHTAVSRGGVSILSNVGLPELIAQTTDEYVKIAVDLANDLPRLAGIRSTLRSQMQASPLMDVPRFTRNMEAAFRTMWKKWCARA